MDNRINGRESQKSLLNGIDILSNTIKSTLGPKGRNVMIEKKNNSPVIIHEGAAIARIIEEIEDAEGNVGAKIVRKLAIDTNEKVGDGSTIACTLAQAMIHEGEKNIAAGASPVFIRIGMNKALKNVISFLKEASVPVIGTEDIVRIASVSSNDVRIGSLIAEAIKNVGEDGIVTTQDSNTTETYSEIIKGMHYNLGYISPFMITDEDDMSATLDDAYILISDSKISKNSQIVPILEKVMHSGKKLLIIADEVKDEALSTILLNHRNGILTCVCVKAPAFGDRRKEMLEDIAVYTGGQFIDDTKGTRIEDMSVDMLGSAKQVKITKDRTVIINGGGNEQDIQNRISLIKAQSKASNKGYELNKVKERLARLSGRIAVINVAAPSEVEREELKARISNAIRSTEVALEEGILAGGGIAYLKASHIAEESAQQLEGDEKVGAQILSDALSTPLRQMSHNAGLDGSVIIKNIETSEIPNCGYDFQQNKYVDMLRSGIVDPAKVCRTAIENAVSSASTFLTTEHIVPYKKSQDKDVY